VDRRGTATGLSAVLAGFEAPSDHFGTAPPRELWRAAVARHDRNVGRLAAELGIQSWCGPARVTGSNSAEVYVDGSAVSVSADLLLVCTGTVARRVSGFSLNPPAVFLPEDVPSLGSAPRKLIVLGANRTARAFAGLFAAAGSEVRLITSRAADARFRDNHLKGDVLDLRRDGGEVRLRLTDGRELAADALLFAAGRAGDTAELGLSAAGLPTDEDGRLWCDDEGRTWVGSIYAAGDVVGYPASLRRDPDAARRVVRHMLAAEGVCVQPAERPSLASFCRA
jgi:pyruvate/2-oxoglutarate dehydrogenase complex dihydrolipoamide dehydrogenase (E3) component